MSHLFGSGFPKSLDVSKAIDAAVGAARSGTGEIVRAGCRAARDGGELVGSATIEIAKWKEVTVPATDAAKQWDGWGTALKPACEDWWLCRKPLEGSVAQNVLEHGTGGLNIDGCRVDGNMDSAHFGGRQGVRSATFGQIVGDGYQTQQSPLGRWPANVIHDGSDEVLAGFPETESGESSGLRNGDKSRSIYGAFAGNEARRGWEANEGSAARFFYCAKASQEDRNEGLEDLPVQSAGAVTDRKDGSAGLNSPRAGAGRTNGSRNVHPTVKPTELMRYLCRLVTPPGGLVLDPFCGSGSTGKAAMLEGFKFVGIELNAEYCELAQRRIEAVTRQGLLFG